MAKILIADDEQLIRKLIGDHLTKLGHEVFLASDGEQALKIFNSQEIDLALLDIMMPELDGWQVCKKIRESSGIPILLVSARSQDFDQIMGFESGADDYVTKPFSLVVLTQRINSLLKRGASATDAPKKKKEDTLETDGLEICEKSYDVTLDGNKIDLTLKEFSILFMLCKSPDRVYSRDEILNRIWGVDYIGDTRTVDSHMARLRTKLGAWGAKHITTVYGIGYKVVK